MIAAVDVSFVILTWNSESYISRCLDSLLVSLEGTGLSFEIFVVDNGSRDTTADILKVYEKTMQGVVIPIFFKTNLGTTVSRNAALRMVRGVYICVMDSDVEAIPGVFPKLIEVLCEEPKVGMVVPQILYPSGRWQKSTDRFPTLMHKINRYFRLRQIEAAEESAAIDNTEKRDVDYAISALWLFRSEVLETVGLLDEKIFYAPEDVDYCLRIWEKGYRILYFPAVHVIHHTQEISRGFKFNKAKIEHVKGLIYLFIKHRYVFVGPKFKAP
ncbi:MAG: glycosyltransferase [Geobacter sp.]|nr:glycosyltransferase [Geobacter sp.]